MNSYPYEGEVRLLRWGESSTAGRTITLELPPDAGEVHPFKGFPVGTKTGQRFRMRFAVILDDETTPEPPAQAEAPARVPPSDRSDAARLAYQLKDGMAKAATRAAMLCKEPTFQDFLSEKHHSEWHLALTTEHPSHPRSAVAAAVLRMVLGITSRSQIASNETAYELFLQLELEYKAAVGRFAEAR